MSALRSLVVVSFFASLSACGEGVESISEVGFDAVDPGESSLDDEEARRRRCRDTDTKKYVAVGDQCQTVRFVCEPGWAYFADNCGCGCEFVGEACGANVCGADEYCCNESCGICAPIDGGVCTQQFCG